MQAIPDVMTITVEAPVGTFERRTLTNGALLYTNRIYTLINIPAEFEGFDFLASNGGEVNSGTIVPSTNGIIYVMAKSGGLTGWTEIENSKSMILTVELSIYQKQVTAGDRIPIPGLTNFQGATPLAKRIKYGSPTVMVKGELIDIKDSAIADDYVFAQNESFTFKNIPTILSSKKYAFSTSDRIGVTQFSCDDTCTVYVALNYQPTVLNNWTNTATTLTLNRLLGTIPIATINYYIYKYKYSVPGVTLNVLQATSGDPKSSLFFADRLQCTDKPTLPGIVITRSLEPKKIFITNPSITILPDGDYLAACTGAYRVTGTSSAGVSFFLSSDKGQTWKAQSINNGAMSYQNLFVHNGTLYLMGTSGVQSDVIIRKSTDKGITWTYPTNDTDGILLTGQYHSAPVPLVVSGGRIWRAFETNVSGDKDAFVMSATVNSDLLNAANWTITNALSHQASWISGEGKTFKQWLEGNVVMDKNGNIVNILRIDEEKYGGVAAIATVTGTSQLSFNPATDIINFPGGGKKFTIRYDAITDKYWTITNAEFDEDRTKTQAGIYNNGTHCGLLRNRLVLMSSPDLRNWTIKDTLISYDNPFLYGFQYIDWLFDGNDIIAVSRTAFEDERGLPVRQHDANYFLFHRFRNFRTGLISSIIIATDELECRIAIDPNQIEIIGEKINEFDISIYDISGRVIYSKIRTDNRKISMFDWRQGTYIVKINCNGKSFTQKIIK